MLTGPQQMPVFSNGVLTVDDKRAIIGYLNELHEQPERPLPHTGNDISPEHPHRARQLSDTG